jgi:hypothetical protein
MGKKKKGAKVCVDGGTECSASRSTGPEKAGRGVVQVEAIQYHWAAPSASRRHHKTSTLRTNHYGIAEVTDTCSWGSYQ